MPTARAAGELLAPPEDVWLYVSEPYHLPDWWPGLASVEPDRRGFAAGARWQVRRREPTLFRRADADDTLLVTAVELRSRFAFELVRARLEVELTLAPRGRARTYATLAVSGPLVLVFSRRLPKDALARLHDLCQTAATI